MIRREFENQRGVRKITRAAGFRCRRGIYHEPVQKFL
jgi:hypothetical protein